MYLYVPGLSSPSAPDTAGSTSPSSLLAPEFVLWVLLSGKPTRLLEVVSVRVERLHDITEDDAAREGVTWGGDDKIAQSAREAFRCLWDAINPDTWAANPHVWRVEFRRVTS